MTTITYTLVNRCSGGGHTKINVSVGAFSQDYMFDSDDIRAPLSSMTEEERQDLALRILKAHFAGATRAQIVAEFQAGPVVVTV